MRKAMKGMKRRSMKAMKSMKKRSMKKRVSKTGKRVSVFHGTKHHTNGGCTKNDFKKNRAGRIVSRRVSDQAKKSKGYKVVKAWAAANVKARKALGIRGFVPMGGKTARGQALLKKARSLMK